MRKHRPHLLDEAVIFPRLTDFPRKFFHSAVPRARRFVFDDQASMYLGDFVRECEDLILINRQFAIPPTDPCYIQINIEAMQVALDRPYLRYEEGSDIDLGYLCVGKKVFTIAGDRIQKPVVSPLAIEVGVPASREMLFAQRRSVEEWNRLAFFLGTSIHSIPNEDIRQDILTNNNIVNYVPAGVDLPPLVESSLGELRTLWAALLLINQKKGVTLQDVPAKSIISGGKRMVYARHTVIKFDLTGGNKNMRKFALEGRDTPRRHQVRGHFAHRNVTEGCEHLWPQLPDDQGHWICGRCHGTRWWRKDHYRGDASKGFITHEYDITASGC